jgi:gamma-butyrobetaine dioxygenase
LPFAQVEGYYRAYDRFVRLARARSVRLALGAGDFLLYDNCRMLYARTAFRGARWLRGVYFDQAVDAAGKALGGGRERTPGSSQGQ